MKICPLIASALALVCISYANPLVHKNSLQRAITFTEPTEPLQFRDNVKKKPKGKNLKKSRLLRKMGLDFKPEWMSIEEPANIDTPTVSPNS